MVASLAHRGPDGAGAWVHGAIGLGHRLLATTPESLHEQLPLLHPTEPLALTADVRLDNRDELMGALGILDPMISDSALLLKSYEEWGERCPERLLGDFAFAVWDGRCRTLFCARDHMGVKPFYYFHKAGRMCAFASEMKALLCLPEIPHRLNEVRVADLLVPMLEDQEATIFRDLLRLPPGHCMTVSREGSRLRRYWAPDPSLMVQPGSDEEYAGALRKLFMEAVNCRLRSVYPVGATLSGGLDSSSITVTARHLLGSAGLGPLHTFSCIFDEVPECDERAFIKAVLAAGADTSHFVHGDRLAALATLDRPGWQEDELYFFPNHFLFWALYNKAREQGVRVLLDGNYGDDTLSHGMGFLPELARAGHLVGLATEIAGFARRFNVSRWSALRTHVLAPLLPPPMRRVWRWLRGRERWDMDPVIRRDFAVRIGLAERLAAFCGDQMRPARGEREAHRRDLSSGLIAFSNEALDLLAGVQGVEPRYPFLDKRLVEFCLACPGEQKIRHGQTRMVMRRAMAGLLPEPVRWRDGKTSLSANFHRALLTFERLRLERIIFTDSTVIEPYVDLPVLRSTYHRFLKHRRKRDAFTIWRIVYLANWLQRAGIQP